MPGIPKTKRCERCRRRKIKCDENWPACASCKRSNVVCSGPPTGSKFVYNNRHGNQHAAANAIPSDRRTQLVPSGSNDASARTISSRTMPDGSSMSSFRLSSTPRSYPTTVSDRVAGRMVAHLEKSPTKIRDFILTCNYFQLLPARLGHCVALRDCVALFSSAWANFQRGLPCSEVTDQKSYSKALRSLQKVLGNEQPGKSEALAAVSVLERFEIMFDPGRPLYWSSHRDGIIALMARRGPPKLDDQMYVWLALDNYNILAAHWLVRGGHNFYDDKDWKAVMRDAVASSIDMSEMKKNAYRMELYLGSWSSMTREMRQICEAPESESRRVQALDLQRRAKALAAELGHVGGPMVERGRAEGKIVELPDAETPVGAKYDFADMDALRCFVTYITLRIVLNRIIWGLYVVPHEPAPAFLDVEHRDLCRKIWMCLPYVRDVSLMAAILFGDPLYVSYEGARGETKEYLLTWLMEIAQFRKRLPDDRRLVDQHLMDSATAFTGRSMYRERSDFPYSKLRSSAL